MEYFFRIPQANHPARPWGSRNFKKERNGAIDPISAEEKAQGTDYGEQVAGHARKLKCQYRLHGTGGLRQSGEMPRQDLASESLTNSKPSM